MRIALLVFILLLAGLVCPGAAFPGAALPGVQATPDFLLCQQATASAEHASGVPDQLLDAISRVESGRPDPTGAIRGWPWTINVKGEGHFYPSKAEAVTAARQYIAAGNRSIDIGCAQINLMFHPDAFASLDDAFDPTRNANYAARFLTDLFHSTGSWPHAAAAYHSQTPELGTDYQARVLAAWANPIGETHAASRPVREAALPHPTPHGRPATIQPATTPVRPPAFGSMMGMASASAPMVLRQGHGQLVGLVGRDLGSYRARPVAVLVAAGGAATRFARQ